MGTFIPDPIRCTDPGFFGPDSIAWRVTGPTFFPMVSYAGVMFFLTPQNAAIGFANTEMGLDNLAALKSTARRAVDSVEYMFAVFYGDRATATQAAAILNAIHDHVRGTWAPTGDRVHVASEPHNLLWGLVAGFGQGMLNSYDAYGPKRLTLEERDRFWRDEATVMGELQQIPRDMIPKSQAEADDYLEQQRPFLAVTETSRTMVFDTLFPSLISGSGALPAPLAPLVRLATSPGVALVPDHIMHLVGQRPYPRPLKFAIRAVNRPFYATFAATPILRNLFALSQGRACWNLERRARAAARTGQYDPPAEVEVDRKVDGRVDRKVAVSN